MIVGTGIDLVTVSRMEHWLENEALCSRFFHPVEMATVRSRGQKAACSLAARFAAKEAFVKALGTGFSGLCLRDIRVENEQSGRPVLVLEGKALKMMEGIGAGKSHLSLSYEGNIATAQVILEAIDG